MICKHLSFWRVDLCTCHKQTELSHWSLGGLDDGHCASPLTPSLPHSLHIDSYTSPKFLHSQKTLKSERRRGKEVLVTARRREQKKANKSSVFPTSQCIHVHRVQVQLALIHPSSRHPHPHPLPPLLHPLSHSSLPVFLLLLHCCSSILSASPLLLIHSLALSLSLSHHPHSLLICRRSLHPTLHRPPPHSIITLVSPFAFLPNTNRPFFSRACALSYFILHSSTCAPSFAASITWLPGTRSGTRSAPSAPRSSPPSPPFATLSLTRVMTAYTFSPTTCPNPPRPRCSSGSTYQSHTLKVIEIKISTKTWTTNTITPCLSGTWKVVRATKSRATRIWPDLCPFIPTHTSLSAPLHCTTQSPPSFLAHGHHIRTTKTTTTTTALVHRLLALARPRHHHPQREHPLEQHPRSRTKFLLQLLCSPGCLCCPRTGSSTPTPLCTRPVSGSRPSSLSRR